MDANSVEVECPVCDHKVTSDAAQCPHCGAEFSMSGVDELERVAREMDGPPETAPPAVQVVKAAEAGQEVTVEDPKDAKGLFGRFFKKKK